MTDVDELLSDLGDAVGWRRTTYSHSSAVYDIYEGFVFGLVIRAAVAAGASVRYQDAAGTAASTLVFRTSPGMLYSDAQPYTHAVLQFPDCAPLEAHVGVRVQGKSGVLHECDVLVLPTDEANLSRARVVAPRGSRSLLAVECKYYTSHLALYLARGFHGLQADLGLRYPYFVANIRSRRIERYLSHHKRNWEHGVMPSVPEARYFEGQVREAFKQHQAVRGALAP
jgi:hypothetical protein